MGVVLSGQAAPIVTHGVFLYSGTQLIADTPAVGEKLYWEAAGELSTTAIDERVGAHIGVALGALDENNHVLVKLDFRGI